MIGLRRRRRRRRQPQQRQPLLSLLGGGYVLWAAAAAAAAASSTVFVQGFAPYANHLSRRQTTSCFTSTSSSSPKTWLAVAHYSPPPSESSSGDTDSQEDEDDGKSPALEQNSIRFQNLVSTVMATSNPDHIPSLLTKEIDFLLSLKGEDVVHMIQGILTNVEQEDNDDDDDDDDDEKDEQLKKTEEAIDMILSFAEAFVEQANEMDDSNKKLLGKIIRAIAPPDIHHDSHSTSSSSSSSLADREERLDALLISERENFTPRFLRHLQGECHRISTAKKQTRETARMLEVLQIIEARIVEELGKHLGEAATVLGQLIVYETASERLAVLNAGLTVRDVELGKELLDLATEAVEGLQNHPGADPELVQRVVQIQDGIQTFLARKTTN